MISKQELRLNNWVQLVHGKIKGRIVAGELSEFTFSNEKARLNLTSEKRSEIHEYSFESIEGIVVTPSILLNAGFSEQKGQYQRLVSGLLLSIQLLPEVTVATITNGVRSTIFSGGRKYLHQLQNLYFVVTKEELEIAF